MHETKTESRLLATLLRDVLRTEAFDSLADLIEALKCRCARHRIRWSNDGLSDALRLVASNRPLLRRERRAS